MNVCECSQDTTFTHLAKTLYAKLTQFLGGCCRGYYCEWCAKEHYFLLYYSLCVSGVVTAHIIEVPPASQKCPSTAEIETNESQKSLMSSPRRGQFFTRNVS